MSNNGIVTIHGKEYMTVAKRVEIALAEGALESVTTEVLSDEPSVVIKATVIVKGKPFTGISAVSLNSSTFIEKNNPYEVAETSAVGRALGFAGYGLIEGIASADEIVKSEASSEASETNIGSEVSQQKSKQIACEVCGKPATEKKGISKTGKEWHGIFCSSEDRSHTRWLWN